jgi:RNA polymerase sigma factor (sigma-70 family)
LENVAVEWHDRDVDLLDLADALVDLAQESARLRDVVTLHWFGRMTHAEVAGELGVSASTVEKDFRYALAWLNRRLQEGRTSGD